jgi:TrmH family RNA methyltransferase
LTQASSSTETGAAAALSAMPDVISSTASSIFKHLLKLGSSARHASQSGTALVCGSERTVGDVLRLSAAAPDLLVLPKGQESLEGYEATHWATNGILRKLCGVHSLDSGLGAAAEVRLPAGPTLAQASRWRRILVLDGVSDPGNVGALLRTALGLGWDGAVLTRGCAAATSPKVFRASGGVGVWQLPWINQMEVGGSSGLAELLRQGARAHRAARAPSASHRESNQRG